ncbi:MULTISPECIES: hypothetical protein [unclassified Leptolyngbya]|nr:MULTISPECIES: hypothetical protein [unclassified Leptolyngbya]
MIAGIAETVESRGIATNALFIYLAIFKFPKVKQDKEFNPDDSF